MKPVFKKNKWMKALTVSCFLLMLFFSSGCVSVQTYQKMYLNDTDMALKPRKVEKPELEMEVFREGASGANYGKTGGGCGCN